MYQVKIGKIYAMYPIFQNCLVHSVAYKSNNSYSYAMYPFENTGIYAMYQKPL